MRVDLETAGKIVGVAAAAIGVLLWGSHRLIQWAESRVEQRQLAAKTAELEAHAEQSAKTQFEQEVARDQTRTAVQEIKTDVKTLVTATHEQDKSLAVLVDHSQATTRRLDELTTKVGEHGDRITRLESKEGK